MARPDMQIGLPEPALRRLAQPLREAINETNPLNPWHTLPVTPEIWNIYAERISTAAATLNRIHAAPPSTASLPDLFPAIQSWIRQLLEAREAIIGFVMALAPFKHFDEDRARSMLGEVDTLIYDAYTDISTGTIPCRATVLLDCKWLSLPFGTYGHPIHECLGTDPDETHDESGEFSPSRVLAFYYLQNGELNRRVFEALAGLWGRNVGDVLIGMSCVGWILEADDPVAAYCSLETFRRALSRSSDSCRTEVLEYLQRNERSLRHNRDRVRALEHQIHESKTIEQRNLTLAELYKRLIEGPFRKYGWALYSLDVDAWTPPPTLTPLRESMISRGGWLGSLAQQAVLTDIRNGEAHETLVWDGVREKYDVEGTLVSPREVGWSTIIADAFARGSQAAIVLWRSSEVDFGRKLPSDSDPGRTTPEERAIAHFGSNGIGLLRANFNALTAEILCSKIALEDVNPCFQALVSCHRLLPHVEQFNVSTTTSDAPIIAVSRAALEKTLDVWEFAIERFTAMPFTAFLPANLDNRSRFESSVQAAKAVAWIATDDYFDAVNDTPDYLDIDMRRLIGQRAALIKLALNKCMAAIPAQSQTRVKAVRDRVSRVGQWLESNESDHVSIEDVLGLPDSVQLRFWWKKWGPADRSPGVVNNATRDPSLDERPRQRGEPGDLRWRTI